MTVLHDNLGNPIDAKNPLPVDVSTSDAIVPTDIQSHLQTTIQTHNAVSVAANTNSLPSSWSDSDGVDKIAYSALSNASYAWSVQIYWSNDGSSTHGIETPSASSSVNYKVGLVDTKARYFKICITNSDATNAQTISAWAYLKA